MNCPNCGAANEPDARFCAECGAPLKSQAGDEDVIIIEPPAEDDADRTIVSSLHDLEVEDATPVEPDETVVLVPEAETIHDVTPSSVEDEYNREPEPPLYEAGYDRDPEPPAYDPGYDREPGPAAYEGDYGREPEPAPPPPPPPTGSLTGGEGGEPFWNRRNTITVLIVLILLLCCCCAALLIGAALGSGVLNEEFQGLGLGGSIISFFI